MISPGYTEQSTSSRLCRFIHKTANPSCEQQVHWCVYLGLCSGVNGQRPDQTPSPGPATAILPFLLVFLSVWSFTIQLLLGSSGHSDNVAAHRGANKKMLSLI